MTATHLFPELKYMFYLIGPSKAPSLLSRQYAALDVLMYAVLAKARQQTLLMLFVNIHS